MNVIIYKVKLSTKLIIEVKQEEYFCTLID